MLSGILLIVNGGMGIRQSFVVTGGAQGIGRVIAERLAGEGHVVVIDAQDPGDWPSDRIASVVGDAGDPETARRAVTAAEAAGPLAGWVNNAAVFRDAGLATASVAEILELV